MTDDLCPREAEVLRACESGDWAGLGEPALPSHSSQSELRAHLATCESCREVEAVTRVLMLSVEAESAEPIPDAADVWWRAQWQARQDARARAMRPLDTIERAEPLVALVAVATLLVMRGDVIASRIFGWVASDATGHALQTLMPPAILPLLFVGIGLGGLVLLVGLGAVVAKD
jgi:hypothetical protein